MAEINSTTHDEYKLKAGGVAYIREVLHSGLKLGHILFGTAEEVSKSLQAKDTTLQQVL